MVVVQPPLLLRSRRSRSCGRPSGRRPPAAWPWSPPGQRCWRPRMRAAGAQCSHTRATMAPGAAAAISRQRFKLQQQLLQWLRRPVDGSLPAHGCCRRRTSGCGSSSMQRGRRHGSATRSRPFYRMRSCCTTCSTRCERVWTPPPRQGVGREGDEAAPLQALLHRHLAVPQRQPSP